MTRQRPARSSGKGEDLVALVKAQQAFINAQRHYAQQLEDLLSSAHSHLLPPALPAPAPCPPLATEGILCAVRRRRAEWAGEVGGLEAENGELKNILDNMIALVREEKRGRG